VHECNVNLASLVDNKPISHNPLPRFVYRVKTSSPRFFNWISMNDNLIKGRKSNLWTCSDQKTFGDLIVGSQR